jgi:hypothetical protein
MAQKKGPFLTDFALCAGGCRVTNGGQRVILHQKAEHLSQLFIGSLSKFPRPNSLWRVSGPEKADFVGFFSRPEAGLARAEHGVKFLSRKNPSIFHNFFLTT